MKKFKHDMKHKWIRHMGTFLRGTALFALLMWAALSEPSAAQVVEGGLRVPVLMFHEVTGGTPKSASEISLIEFEAVLKELKASGYEAIHLQELEEHLNGRGGPLPEKPVILTFDDGYASNYSIAYPLLKKHGMKASYFVIGWSVGRNTLITPNDVTSVSKIKRQRIIGHFNGTQMTEMASSGLIAMENHTFDLHSPAGMSLGYRTPVGTGISLMAGEDLPSYEKRVGEDLERMQQLIRSQVGRKPRYLAYPYGTYQPAGEALARKIGFKATLTTKRGIRLYAKPEDLYEMPRINIRNLEDLRAMELIPAEARQ